MGPGFAAAVQEPLIARIRRLTEHGFDLSLHPPCTGTTGNTTGHCREAYAYPDSRHEIVTVLVCLSHDSPYERGRLRVLRIAAARLMAEPCGIQVAGSYLRAE